MSKEKDKVVNPTELVKDGVFDKQAEELLEKDEVEQSARTIHILFQNFRKLGYQLADRKKKAPIRVLEALLFDGLEDVKLNGKLEENLLDISRQIVYHKSVLIDYAMERKQEKEENKNENE